MLLLVGMLSYLIDFKKFLAPEVILNILQSLLFAFGLSFPIYITLSTNQLRLLSRKLPGEGVEGTIAFPKN